MSLRYCSLRGSSSSTRTAVEPKYFPDSEIGGCPRHNDRSDHESEDQMEVRPNCSLTIFQPDDLASQLTLLDLAIFKRIQPDELVSCSWNKKNKLEVAPNVVAFTKRFNHISFWVVEEVLRPESAKMRAEILAQFIRVAKRLHELNNLHAEFAILSAMQSAPLFRLGKTWSHLARRERQTFDKLTELFSEVDNFARLREHMNSIALKHNPCVPYLGLYLTDLVYIDMAHPHSGGLESQQRQIKMNNILRIVSELQQSNYNNLVQIEECQKYLSSTRYIDELQKFVEDDQWKRSLQLEPVEYVPSSSSSSKESISVKDPNIVAELNLSPAKAVKLPLSNHDFIPGHRKSRSDGGSIFLACGRVSGNNSSEALPEFHTEMYSHHLLDDSLLEVQQPIWCSSEQLDQPLAAEHKATIQRYGTECSLQSAIKRKTLIKDGKRPTISSWQRYWMQLWGSAIVLYSAKPLSRGVERSDFRNDPCKCQNVDSWLVLVDPKCQEDFQLTDPVQRNVYKFRALTPQGAKAWVRYLHEGVQGKLSSIQPTNLITFE